MNVNQQTNEDEAWALLWDVRRNIRYAALRAGWFDFVTRSTALLTALCSSAAFAAFAGDWRIIGAIVTAISTVMAALIYHFEFPKKAQLYRNARKEYRLLLGKCLNAGGETMPLDALHHLQAAFCQIEALVEDEMPGGVLKLLMMTCENAVARYDMPCELPNQIPTWAVLIRQVWPWAWPAKAIQ